MTEIQYVVTVRTPEEIDADTAAEIAQDAEPHDATEAARIARWLGGEIDAMGQSLADGLPPEWRVSIEEKA